MCVGCFSLAISCWPEGWRYVRNPADLGIWKPLFISSTNSGGFIQPRELVCCVNGSRAYLILYLPGSDSSRFQERAAPIIIIIVFGVSPRSIVTKSRNCDNFTIRKKTVSCFFSFTKSWHHCSYAHVRAFLLWELENGSDCKQSGKVWTWARVSIFNNFIFIAAPSDLFTSLAHSDDDELANSNRMLFFYIRKI